MDIHIQPIDARDLALSMRRLAEDLLTALDKHKEQAAATTADKA
jgi:hypothetical protein